MRWRHTVGHFPGKWICFHDFTKPWAWYVSIYFENNIAYKEIGIIRNIFELFKNSCALDKNNWNLYISVMSEIAVHFWLECALIPSGFQISSLSFPTVSKQYAVILSVTLHPIMLAWSRQVIAVLE